MINTKNMIYKNYLKNYIKKDYKFKNKDFSLSDDYSGKVFFQIKNINILEINHLIIIKINKSMDEWVCDSGCGLYLINKIKGCKKPYQIYSPEDVDIEIKTISNIEGLDDCLSEGVNEFEDSAVEIILDEIVGDDHQYFNFQLLKASKYRLILNLNEQIPKTDKFDFLIELFRKKNFTGRIYLHFWWQKLYEYRKYFKYFDFFMYEVGQLI